MFKTKKEKTLEELVFERIKKGYILDTREMNLEQISIQELTSVIKKAGKYCTENNLCYGVHFSYLGFRDTNGNRDKKIKSFMFSPVSEIIECLFVKEIKTIEDIRKIFANNYEFLPNILRNLGKNLNLSLIKSINMNELPKVNEEILNKTKIHIYKQYKRWEYGYYKDQSFGVGKTFYVAFCNNEILEKNLITLCQFVQAYFNKLMELKLPLYNNFYKEDLNLILSLCPQFLKNETLATEFILNANKEYIEIFLKLCILDERNILMNAIKKTPSCYYKLPSEYQKNTEICMEVLNNDFSMIRTIIENGPIKEEDWKEYCTLFLYSKWREMND